MKSVVWNTCQNCTVCESTVQITPKINREIWRSTLARNATHLYGPLPMRTVCSRHGKVRRRSTAVWSLLVGGAVCSLVVTSCGSTPPAMAKATPTTVATSTSTTTAEDGQVIAAWFAAERAFHVAAETSDPNSPGLEATMVSPILDRVRSSLSQFRGAGDVAHGPVDFGDPQITASGSSGVEVVSCVDDREIETNASTGKPLPGIVGTASVETMSSLMQPTPTGWKLADQHIALGKCGDS